jgi:hypothetical protein
VQDAEEVIVGAGKRDEFNRFCIETLRKFPEPQAGSSTLTPAISSTERLRRLLRPLFILLARPPLADSLLLETRCCEPSVFAHAERLRTPLGEVGRANTC